MEFRYQIIVSAIKFRKKGEIYDTDSLVYEVFVFIKCYNYFVKWYSMNEPLASSIGISLKFAKAIGPVSLSDA